MKVLIFVMWILKVLSLSGLEWVQNLMWNVSWIGFFVHRVVWIFGNVFLT